MALGTTTGPEGPVGLFRCARPMAAVERVETSGDGRAAASGAGRAAAARPCQRNWLCMDVPTCPQLIDPVIDFTAFMLLTRLRGGPDVVVGVRAATGTLTARGRPRPRLVLVTTDAGPCSTRRRVRELVKAAVDARVSVVYTMSTTWMAQAVGSESPVAAVAVMRVPEDVKLVAASICSRGAQACEGFYAALARATQPSPDPSPKRVLEPKRVPEPSRVPATVFPVGLLAF